MIVVGCIRRGCERRLALADVQVAVIKENTGPAEDDWENFLEVNGWCVGYIAEKIEGVCPDCKKLMPSLERTGAVVRFPL